MEKTKEFKRSESNPGALLNTDNSALKAYKQHRETLRKNAKFAERLEKVESCLDEIKQLLLKVVDGK